MLGGQRKRRIDRAIILAEERPRMASASLTNRQSSYGQESRIESVNYLRVKQLYIENFRGAQDLLKLLLRCTDASWLPSSAVRELVRARVRFAMLSLETS